MKYLPFAALAAFIHSASALPADLDLTFNGTGKVTTSIGGIYEEAAGVAVQSNGKIVVVGTSGNASGNTDIAVLRYNTDGSLDTTFNGTGKVTTAIGDGDDTGTCVAVQSDGKIVVAGYFSNGTDLDVAVLRYNSNGSLDTTFGGTGKVTTAIGNGDDTGYCLKVQDDGKIVVGGGTALGGGPRAVAVLRYNTDGGLDTTFNGTGKVITPIGIDGLCQSLAIQVDGRIVASGATVGNDVNVSYDFAVIRYNTNGSLDTTFNGTGKVITAFGGAEGSTGVAVQADGKIVAVGRTNYASPDYLLARYNTNGTLDTTFGGTGKVTTGFGLLGDFALSVALQKNGKVVVAGVSTVTSGPSGNTYVADMARYNTNGSLDTTFNGSGKVTMPIGASSQFNGVAVQRDGKIVFAGWSTDGPVQQIAVARLQGDLDTDGDGLLDWYETGTGVYVSPEDTGTSPTNRDSDGDDLDDGEEVLVRLSDPNIADTDEDGFLDGYEVATGKSPVDALDKPALVAEVRTAIEFTFPAAVGKTYRIEDSTDLATWATVETGIVGAGNQVQRFYSTRSTSKRYFRVEEETP